MSSKTRKATGTAEMNQKMGKLQGKSAGEYGGFVVKYHAWDEASRQQATERL